MRPLLIKVTLNGRELQTLAFTKHKVLIGRESTADIQLDNPGVSRRHAVIEHSNDSLRIRDLSSSNGTLVNGVPTKEKVLAEGDVIGVFKFELHVLELALKQASDLCAPSVPQDQTYQVRPAKRA